MIKQKQQKIEKLRKRQEAIEFRCADANRPMTSKERITFFELEEQIEKLQNEIE